MLDLLRQTSVPIESIRIDGGTQSRVRIDPDTVADYADAMQSGAEFPPVIVYYDGSQYWLADGFHRLQAWVSAWPERTGIPAEVRQGDRREAVLHSVGANDAHGLRRTNEDKRRAVLRLLEDEEWGGWSDREIARRCGVSQPFVGVLRQSLSDNDYQIARTVTRNGTTYTQNTANIGQRAEVKKLPIPTPKEEAKARGGYPEEYESSVERGQWIPIQAAQPEPTPDPLPPTNGNRLAVHFRSETPEHYTPREIVDAAIDCMGGIDTDPCSPGAGLSNVPATTHYTQADDGLSQSWAGRVYMNPPYGRGIGEWVEKLRTEYQDGQTSEAIALVPARTDTQWWQMLRDYPVCLIGGRLRFGDAENAAPFPSAVFYLGENIGNFYRTFSGLGDIWQRVEPFCFGE